MRFDNSEALAYGFMMLILYFIAGVMLMLCWSWAVDILLSVAINPRIVAGEVSLQTVNATAFAVNVLRYSPVAILVFGYLYGVNRGIFTRGKRA